MIRKIYRLGDRHPDPQDIYWLVEVSNSTLIKDLEEKSMIYALNGIPEYWLVDLLHNKLWVFTSPKQNGYSGKEEVTTGNVKPLAFPTIDIKVEEILTANS